MTKASAGMDFLIYLLWMVAAYPTTSLGITTTHHDKPEASGISKMATKMTEHPTTIVNTTLSASERQKRLLPYENFYIAQSDDQPIFQPPAQNSRYQPDHLSPHKEAYPLYTNDIRYYQNLPSNQDALYKPGKFTPFLESNAIPGPFRPIIPNRQQQRVKIQYVHVPQPQQAKVPDYSAIYDKLARLKLENSRRPTYYEPQKYNLNPQVAFVPERNAHKNVQPSKTTIETFTAANIDIPSEQEEYNPLKVQVTPAKNYENEIAFYKSFQEGSKPYVNKEIAVASYPQQSFEALLLEKPYQGRKQSPRPYIVLQVKPEEHRFSAQPIPVQRPIIVIQRRPAHKNKPLLLPQNLTPVSFIATTSKYEEGRDYETPKYEQYQTVQPEAQHFTEPPLQIFSEPPVQSFTETPIQAFTEPPPHPLTETSNDLVHILKQLQDTNTLPHTLTTDNIDNSIKTLVRILEALRKQQKLSKPIVVQDDVSPDYNPEIENDAGVGIGGHEEVSGIISHQSFPGEAPDGGTPGKPGVDYPALSSIPQTSFNCKTQRYKGFFGDPDTNCQVWHYCDLNGGQASFLCPNGTIFSQVALTCDWWYNVKCSSTAQLYVLNERLYKYIIPLSPKFPEDYSGPLVDKYLALKFQEMEEKMKKERKGKGNASKEKQNEPLQEIDTESPLKTGGSPKSSSDSQQRETLETIEDDNDRK